MDTLFEFLGRKAESIRKQGKGRPAKSKQGSPGGSTGWGQGYTALVEKDGLFVRAVAASNPGSHRPPAYGTGAHLKAITEAFRLEFTDIWGLVSRHDDRQDRIYFFADRRCLFQHHCQRGGRELEFD